MLPGLSSQHLRAWGPGARCCGSGSQGLPSLAVAPSSSPCPRPPAPPAPALRWGRGRLLTTCALVSALGLLVRWRLSGFRSCQMGLPEPVGAGWGGSGSPPPEGLEAASHP